MTLTEYKAWLDGMIAATGDERLKVAREKLAEVQEALPPVVVPYRLDPPPFYTPPLRTGEPDSPTLWPISTCSSVKGFDDPNIRCWNGAAI